MRSPRSGLPSRVTCPSPSPLYRALDREWLSLTHDPSSVARAQAWPLDLPTPPESLDDVVLAAGYGNGTVLMVRIADGAEILVRRNEGGAVAALAWNAKGSALAFATEDGDAGLLPL